jgi:hypothetical protein
MKVTARFAIFAAVIASVAAPLHPVQASDFSPAVVFQKSFRGSIDSRCPDARKDAEAIGDDPMTVPLTTVADAYKKLQECAALSRLPQFHDQTTYMQLAAATSAYLIGIRSTGQQADQGFAFAAQLDKRILPADTHTEINMGYQNDFAQASSSGGPTSAGTAPGTPGVPNHDSMRISGTTVNPGMGSAIDLNMLNQMASDLYVAIQTRGQVHPQVQSSAPPYRTP